MDRGDSGMLRADRGCRVAGRCEDEGTADGCRRRANGDDHRPVKPAEQQTLKPAK